MLTAPADSPNMVTCSGFPCLITIVNTVIFMAGCLFTDSLAGPGFYE